MQLLDRLFQRIDAAVIDDHVIGMRTSFSAARLRTHYLLYLIAPQPASCNHALHLHFLGRIDHKHFIDICILTGLDE